MTHERTYSKSSNLTFQGRIVNEEIVYGVCLPASGFSALFVLMSLLTVVSIIVSGFVCYQRQMQKVQEEEAAPRPTPAAAAQAHPAPLMTLRHAPVHAQPQAQVIPHNNKPGKGQKKDGMPPVMGVPSQMMSATPTEVIPTRPQTQQQMGWGFNTWFRKTREQHHGIPAEMY